MVIWLINLLFYFHLNESYVIQTTTNDISLSYKYEGEPSQISSQNLTITFALQMKQKLSQNPQQHLKHTSHMMHNIYTYNVQSASSEVLTPCLCLTHEKDSHRRFDRKIKP